MGFRSYIREFLVAILMLFRPSGPCCLGVAEAPFLSLESWKTATFLVGSESNVRGAGSELGKLGDGYFSCRFRKQR